MCVSSYREYSREAGSTNRSTCGTSRESYRYFRYRVIPVRWALLPICEIPRFRPRESPGIEGILPSLTRAGRPRSGAATNRTCTGCCPVIWSSRTTGIHLRSKSSHQRYRLRKEHQRVSTVWERCLARLEADLTPEQLNTWIRPLHAVEDGTLVASPPRTLRTGSGRRRLPRAHQESHSTG